MAVAPRVLTVRATSCTPASGTTFALGTTTVARASTDAAGNTGRASFKITVRDTTRPTIVFTGGQASYSVADTIAIACTATDAVSGSLPCAGVTGHGYDFTVGTNTITRQITDAAGNVATAPVSFLITSSPGTIADVVTQLAQTGAIESEMVGPLLAKLNDIASANPNIRANRIQAFRNQVNAQTGHKITPAAAALLALADTL